MWPFKSRFWRHPRHGMEIRFPPRAATVSRRNHQTKYAVRSTSFPPEFRQAAFLQMLSFIYQTIPGFVAGGRYTVSFYLGSRFAYGFGDQHVRVILGGVVIYDEPLQSSMPFTLIHLPFVASVGGPLTLVFEGVATTGDQTAFFSGVSIEFN